MKKTITTFKGVALAVCGLFSCALIAQPISLQHLGTYHSGVFDEGAAEIVAYHPGTFQLFVVNANNVSIDILDISDPENPGLSTSIDMTTYGASANSVAVHGDLIAVAVENVNKQDAGKVVFFDTTGMYISDVTVGSLPDMVTFTPDGKYVLCANEGEPSDDYLNDPEGTVSIIDISSGVISAVVSTADFTSFNSSPPSDPSIRIYGNNGSQTFAQDVEPEYITVSADSKTAFVSLQENNAIAKIDIETANVTDIYGCGFKDHSLEGNGLDASDKDETINIRNWPVFGMYQPDGIAAFEINGTTYLVTANEGDARDYGAYAEEERIKDLTLDITAFPNFADLQMDDSLGRLTVTLANGDTDNDGEYEELYVLGGRSFAIFDENGNFVFDSGDDFEQITAQEYPDYFNATNDENDSFKNRSDNKGPEPEGVAIAQIEGNTYAFIVLERIGGIMAYDISDPNNPLFIQFLNNRDFTAEDTAQAAGDLGPEGIIFISKEDSPNGQYLIVTGNEISGTTSIFQIDVEVGIQTLNNLNNPLKVYPNPVTGNEIKFNKKIDGKLFDATGRIIKEFSNVNSINISELNSGYYHLVSSTGEHVSVVKP